MAIASRLFTVRSDAMGEGEVLTPSLLSWYLHSINFIAPQPPRVPLPEGANIDIKSTFLGLGDFTLVRYSEAASSYLRSINRNINAEARATTHLVVNTLSFGSPDKYLIADYLISDWPLKIVAIAPTDSANAVEGSEWDVEIFITDKIAGRQITTPLPEGFKLVGNR